MFVRGAFVWVALWLCGCGWLSDDKGIFVDRRDDYLDAKPGPQLVVPDDLEKERLQDPFPIPPVPSQPNEAFYPDRPPLPDTIYSNDNRDEVRIQRINERRWLVIPEAPTTVWPKLKQFLAENGVSVAAEAPSRGRINTDWLVTDGENRDVVRQVLNNNRPSTPSVVMLGQDRLLLGVERGMRPRTTEVHVRHENDAVQIPSTGVADLASVTSLNTAVEQDFLNELGAYIAAKVSEQTVSMVAQEIGTQPKAEMIRDANGQPALQFNLDIERSWATVGQSLSNASVEVVEFDVSQRTYDILVSEATFIGDEEGPGFFGRLFSFGDDEVKRLRLHLQANARHHELSVTDTDEQVVERELAQRVLILVREFAS